MINFVKTIEKLDISNLMYEELDRIKNLDNPSEIEDTFRSKFYSWDKGDCSITGLLNILLWYVASIENSDFCRMNEYGELIKAIENIHF